MSVTELVPRSVVPQPFGVPVLGATDLLGQVRASSLPPALGSSEGLTAPKKASHEPRAD